MKPDEKKCPQCAEIIKLDARVCRHCGHTFSDDEIAAEKKARHSSSLKTLGIVIAVILGIAFLAAIAGNNPVRQPVASNSNADMVLDNMDATADKMTATAEATTNSMGGGSAWTYADTPDKMRGGVARLASLESTDTLHLSPPYGETTPTLRIRRDPKFGFDIYFTSEGQPLCRPFMSGRVDVKFDNGHVQSWGCNEAADGSPGVVFFDSAKRMLEKIKGAKTMTIETEYYDAGRQTFSFNVAGLKW